MQQPKLAYEVSLGSYSNRGQIMTEDGLTDYHWMRACQHGQAMRSMFAFEENALRSYLENREALNKEINTDVYMPTIVLDFDGAAVDVSDTLVQVRNYVKWLTQHLDVPEEYIKVWFSGFKGFHVELDGRLFNVTPSPHLPDIIKQTIKQNMHHPLIDLAPVNTAGLIRAPFSKHLKGTYKTLIPLRELFSQKTPACGVLPSMADRIEAVRWPEEPPDPVLSRLVLPYRSRSSDTNTTVSEHDPTRLVTCMQKLAAHGPVQGRRHQDVLRLASWLWRSGLPKEYALKSLSGWLPDKELERIVNNTYTKGYTYGCKDEVMQEHCSSQCIFSKQRNYSMYVQGHEELAKNLEGYQALIDSGEGIDLYKLYEISDKKSYRILPGSLVLIFADTGMGKSLFMQDMLVRLRGKTLYLNLEMAESLVTRRFIQSTHNMTRSEVEEVIRDGGASDLVQKLDWLKMVSDAPTLDAVERACNQFKPKYVVVDTTDGINVPNAGNNEMWHLRQIIEGLRKIAQTTNATVFAIHHISKSGSRAISGEDLAETARGLSLNDATGNRSNVTKMDHVIGIEGHRASWNRLIRTLKSRDDDPFEANVIFNFPRMRVTTTTAKKKTTPDF